MIAIFGKMKLFIFIAGMFFVVEGASSFVQVFGLTLFGRRLLPFACPVHHHFLNNGISERKITIISWIFSLIMGILAIWVLFFTKF
jgi:UDP-N-acetylmuramyl pentapeptide phosphotransferase/UDP-N-acetylglucosamine-1-phosphate transferase